MNDIEVLPFKNYEKFLKKDIYVKLKNFYKSFEYEGLHQRVKSINKTLHQVEFYKDSYLSNESDFDTFYFETKIKHILLELTQNTLEQLLVVFQGNYHDQDRIKGLLDFYNIQLKELFNSKVLKEFPFLEKYHKLIFKEIVNYTIPENVEKSSAPKYLNLIVPDDENQKGKIELLYNLLIESPPIIDCSKDDFIKLFSNKECHSGIKWLIMGSRNKAEISKPSLVYFLRTLADIGHIDKSYFSYENSIIINVFRDNLGNKFDSKRLSTSKSNMSKTPSQKERLDNIIAQL